MAACSAQIGSISDDHDAAAGVAQRGGGALADVAEAGDHGHLAGHHDVGAAADAVDEALAAAVEIVELRFRHGVVDVDGREQQLAVLLHLVEAGTPVVVSSDTPLMFLANSANQPLLLAKDAS